MAQSAADSKTLEYHTPVHAPSSAPRMESVVVWTLWLTYGAFYFCRTNISAAVPGMKASPLEGGLGLSSAEIGWILASLKIAYGLGQLLNGQLSERFSPRIMLAIGMFGSAALNVVFGFSTALYFLLFVWAANGFCQSLGWTPTVRVAANWVPVARRGKAMGIIGTGYQITFGLTYVIAAQAAEHLGWRAALYVPALLLALAGIFMLVFLREAPSDYESPGMARKAAAPSLAFRDSLYWTLYNPALWLLGLTLGLLNACRYGYLDWGLTHLMERQSLAIGAAGLKYFVIAIGAAAGSYLAGWATDRFFGSRRAPVICILLALLGVLSFWYDWIVQRSEIGTVLMLVVIGFCLIGPQVLLVGTAPSDLAHRGAAAAAAGFVNFLGYMGAATGDVVTGYFSAEKHGGWETVIHIWTAWAFAGAVITAILWNTTSRKVGIIPAIFPKFASILCLVAAATVIFGRQSHFAFTIAAAGVVAMLLATFASRFALLGIVTAIAGLLFVFIAYIRGGQSIRGDETAVMLLFALTILTSLMVLVEKKEIPCE